MTEAATRPARPSSLDWLTELPAAWDEREVGREVYVRARLGWKGLTASEYVDDGIPMLATPDIKGASIGYAGANKISTERYEESPEIMLKPGDVLLTKDGSTIGTVNVVRDMPGPATVNGSIAVLTPTHELDGRYLYWFIASSYAQATFDRLRGGMGVPHLFQRDINRIKIPFPPVAEQRAIADHLDRETARVDTLIAEQQRLIEMLMERRQASIDEVVWRGLDGRDGAQAVIEPAPKVPAHWRIARNKQILAESTGVSADGSEERLSVSHLTGVTPRSEKRVTMIEAESLDGYRLVEPGDLVINTMWAWMGALGVSRYAGIVSPAYGVYRPLPRAEFDPRYFDYLYRSRPYVVEMTRYSRGIWSSRLRIYPDVFLRLPVPVPPLDEQQRVAAHLEEQTAKIDALIAEAERFIELARERRSALITAAVTGQIDVRESVA